MAAIVALAAIPCSSPAESGPLNRGAAALVAPWPVHDRLGIAGREFDLSRADEVPQLIDWMDSLMARDEAARRRRRSEREALLNGRELGGLGLAELKQYFDDPPAVSGRWKRGLEQVKRLAQICLEDREQRAEAMHWLRELGQALENNSRPPAPSRMEIGQPPLVLLDYLNNPIAQGNSPASNIHWGHPGLCDPSAVEPADSSFWNRPRNVAELDLYHGFGRREAVDWENTIWRYAAPKTSYGGCPGFEITDGVRVVKVKFAETMSEPFAARVFWALGYNVDPTDHAESLTIRYNRRLFREFHQRRPVRTQICAFWLVPLHTIELQKRYDPFRFIARAVLKDRTELSGSELRQRLFHDPHREHPEDDPANFRSEVERTIDLLVTVPANVQPRDDRWRSIGPWDFDGLGHEDLRELRGAGLLGAWMGWFDSRFENTRLKVANEGDRSELRHFFTDLGGGLGKAVGPLSRCCESPNQFGWTFTRPRRLQSPGRMTIPFRIVGYQPIEDTLAFEKMTWDDARWMARWIGRLTEDQIVSALIAAGFDSAHIRVYGEKLIARRDQMLRDLELKDEIAPLRRESVDQRFSYDPAGDGVPTARLPDGRWVRARAGDSIVKDGAVVPRSR